MNPILTKSFTAGGAIVANSIVEAGSADWEVVQANGATATDMLLGVTTEVAAASAERCDVILSGIADVQLGGTVARGGPVTANASGLGIAAAPGAGVNNRVVGFAMISGVSGDIIPVLLAQSLMQG